MVSGTGETALTATNESNKQLRTQHPRKEYQITDESVEAFPGSSGKPPSAETKRTSRD